MIFTSSPTLKDEDVEKHLLLSTSVPIKIGNENTIKKEPRKCGHRIRYTFGLRAVKPSTVEPNESTVEHKIDTNKQTQPEMHDETHHEEPKSKLVDNLSKNNTKLVKQTTIDYYV